MSSSPITASEIFAAEQIILYGGILILIIGVTGEIFNIIVFLSLQTFRQNSCAFYLTIMSIVNIGQLLIGLLSRIAITGFNIDWTQMSLFYCKFRPYLVHIFAFSSLTCVSLAIIDQFLATSIRPHWQQWSSAKTAYYLSGFSLIFWIIYLCPHLIYYELITGNEPLCTITDLLYSQYVDNFLVPFVWYIIPFFVSVLFGLLAYRNIKQTAYRTVPLLRRRIDEQLSIMILVQVIINIIVTFPYIAYLTITPHVSFSDDPLTNAQLQLIKNIALCLYYLYPSVRIIYHINYFIGYV